MVGNPAEAQIDPRSYGLDGTGMASDRGPYVALYGGKIFFPLDPRTDEVNMESIGHALSQICRFAGHCNGFYSVAQHCYHVACYILNAGGSKTEALYGLLHDSAEGVGIGDVISQVKRLAKVYNLEGDITDLKKVERRVTEVIYAAHGLHGPEPDIVKEADISILVAESEDLFPWEASRAMFAGLGIRTESCPKRITPWESHKARHMYQSLLWFLTADEEELYDVS